MILPALEVCEHCSKLKAEHTSDVGHEYERNKRLPEWHGWHAFRRGAATNLNAIGVDDLTISQILGHSDVAITRKCYIKPVNENAVAAMQKLESKLESALIATQSPPIRMVKAVKGVM